MNTTTSSDQPFRKEFAICVVAFNIIVCLPLNVYVLWLIFAHTRETLASDFFSLNVAMAQIFYASSSMLIIVFIQLKLFWAYHAFMFSRGVLYTAQPLFLCFICVEYYAGVIHPVLFLRFKPLRYRVGCCFVIWLITLVSCFYSMYTSTDSIHLFTYFIEYFLIYSIIIFCCCSVLKALKQPGPGEKVTEKKKNNRMKRRAFKMILLIMISLGINFFFYMVVIPLQFSLNTMDFSKALTTCTFLGLMIGFIQPLLYLHRAGKLPCCRGL